ncbi:MAG: MBL fold metallo-hydrolase, partial [Oscillospiraceae bacterium]|nr:MBL fold metallo-hydrolase [Oscillospiraceae bacterium]
KRRKKQKGPLLAGLAAVVAVAVLVFTFGNSFNAAIPTWRDIGQGLEDAFFPPPPSDADQLEIHVFDVGNADCILVTLSGQTLLIDAAEAVSAQKVVSDLKTLQVTKLNYVIATHFDADHIGGMSTVFNTFPVDTFLMAPMPADKTPTTATYRGMLDTMQKKHIQYTEAVPGQTYPLGGATIHILGPVGEAVDNNNHSVVTKITFGSRSFLLMGDAGTTEEQALLGSGQDLSADVLKVGHHGSNTSSGADFLSAVGPRYALISCGLGNPYGHPGDKTIGRLQAVRAQIYRTDVQGTLTVTSDGKTITVSTEK